MKGSLSTNSALQKFGIKIFPLSRKQRNWLFAGVLVILDLLSLLLAFYIATYIRFDFLHYSNPYSELDYRILIVWNLPIWLFLFWAFQLYSPRLLFGGLDEYGHVFNAVTTGSTMLVLLDFLILRAEPISRGWLIAFWVAALVLTVTERFLFRRLVYAIRRRGHLLSPSVIVGAGEEGKMLYQQLNNWHTSGLYVIGFLDDTVPIGTVVAGEHKVLGRLSDLPNIISNENVCDVVVASASLSREQLLFIYTSVAWMPDVTIQLSSGLFEIVSSGLHVKELANVPLIQLNKARIVGLNAAMKVFMDLVIAVCGLILCMPLWMLIALVIVIDSKGPVFYRHRVLGLNGEPFYAWKFRTMYKDADEILERNPELKEEFKKNYKLKDDPRVTRVGKFLRRTSIDEIPQLMNVLAGQMSVVGPRFITEEEASRYGKWRMNLLTVKPGMTGLWQISGRSDLSYQERIRLDMYYIRNWSVWMDLYILIMTLPAVIKRRGAY